MSTFSAAPRARSSATASAAWMVFPNPTSSARRTRQQIYPRRERRAQRSGRRLLCDERAAGATPPREMHEPEHGGLLARLDDVERRKDATLDAAIQRARARQRHELAVVVSAEVGDAPA